jgi:Cu-Zn family superoxide dismutase
LKKPTIMKKYALPLLLCLAVAGCKNNGNGKTSGTTETITLKLEPKSGSNVSGTATFTQRGKEVVFEAKIMGLTPGTHAIHIHEKSDCSDPKAQSAGGHWNPTFKKHGKWGAVEYHKGDIGNFTTDEFGNGTVAMTTDQWCIGCGDQTKDIVGKSLIVHEKADDFVTQPTGNAGGRMACSAIIK